MPPLEGLKNTYHSRIERYPEEFADLVARTENGEFNAFRAMWAGGGDHEDSILFVPPRVSVAKALKRYEHLADENYYLVPVSAEEARERIIAEEQRLAEEVRRAEEARIEAERNAPVDIHGYADFLKAEHQKNLEKPGIIGRFLGRLSISN